MIHLIFLTMFSKILSFLTKLSLILVHSVLKWYCTFLFSLRILSEATSDRSNVECLMGINISLFLCLGIHCEMYWDLIWLWIFFQSRIESGTSLLNNATESLSIILAFSKFKETPGIFKSIVTLLSTYNVQYVLGIYGEGLVPITKFRLCSHKLTYYSV
ncbi:unnamed protein product [Moneuplotes crassus]|uniref:Uncharacterized protein n=1 Tax=Euplotes crassus TaxID=5936 RepID=A0AAD1XMP2_EUPCR|nr:unnamed protein product [Moneuplotes crassus]